MRFASGCSCDVSNRNESVDGAAGVDIAKEGEEKVSVGSVLLLIVVEVVEVDLRPLKVSHL